MQHVAKCLECRWLAEGPNASRQEAEAVAHKSDSGHRVIVGREPQCATH